MSRELPPPAPRADPPPAPAPVYLITGRRGCGKTTYIAQLLARAPRFLVFDHMAEFRTRVAGAHVVYHLEDALAYLKARPSGLARVVFCPIGPAAPLFPLVCRVPFAIPDLWLVVDEIDSLAGSVVPPAPEEFRRMIHFGRHVGCAFVGASRRPADVARLFSSQATRIVCFQQLEPKDLTWLRSVIGPAADQVRTLPALHYLEWNDGQVTAGQVVPGS